MSGYEFCTYFIVGDQMIDLANDDMSRMSVGRLPKYTCSFSRVLLPFGGGQQVQIPVYL